MLQVLSDGFVYCLIPPTKEKQKKEKKINETTPEVSVLFSTRTKSQSVKSSAHYRHHLLATLQVQGHPWHLACSPQHIRCFIVAPPSLYYHLHALQTELSWQDV